MRDVRQLSELLRATGDWTVAGLGSYGQQRAERLRRIRRVSRTFAALMTTLTADGRAGVVVTTRPRELAETTSGWHSARSGSARTAFSRGVLRSAPRIATGLTSITHESRLTESDNLRVASWVTRARLNK
jgi:hypothetical protein